MKQFSEFKKGDMFFFNPLDKDYMKPEVYVMLDEGIVQDAEAKTFIKNSALVKHLISNYQPYPSDLWAITDTYYERMSEGGYIVPIEDLREAEDICNKFGLKMEAVL